MPSFWSHGAESPAQSFGKVGSDLALNSDFFPPKNKYLRTICTYISCVVFLTAIAPHDRDRACHDPHATLLCVAEPDAEASRGHWVTVGLVSLLK